MRQRLLIITVVTIIYLLDGCSHRSEVEYNDMESLLKSMAKNESVEFTKLPPRMVKAFLKLEKTKNDGLLELLDMSKLFIVVHIEKMDNKSFYKTARNNIAHHIEKSGYEQIKEIEFEKIIFREFYYKHNSDMKELVLEIDEKDLYTIYCLKGEFTKEDIIWVSDKVSPIEFLKLNWKIRKK